MHLSFLPPLTVTMLIAVAPSANAYDINDKLSVGGVLAAGGQCQDVFASLPPNPYGQLGGETLNSSMPDNAMDAFGSECRGAMPFQLEVSYRPDAYNEFFVKLGFAVDKGLSSVSPWALAPWAADLEDEVRDINGRRRDYLLAAWYKHTVSLGTESTFGATIGILDSTDYLDGNQYANDEFTQFMNEAFVSSGSYGLPSYDAGAALEWDHGSWSLNAIGMNIGENEDGNNFNFWGAQAGDQTNASVGTGNYRLIVAGGSRAFLDPSGTEKQKRLAWGLSFDQALGDVVGTFLRLAWQRDNAAVDYKALYSGGLDFRGDGWGRDPDNIGVGYAYLDGGNLDLDRTHVLEVYYRFGLNDYLGLTADVQYMNDDRIEIDPRQESPNGWIFGVRLAAEF